MRAARRQAAHAALQAHKRGRSMPVFYRLGLWLSLILFGCFFGALLLQLAYGADQVRGELIRVEPWVNQMALWMWAPAALLSGWAVVAMVAFKGARAPNGQIRIASPWQALAIVFWIPVIALLMWIVTQHTLHTTLINGTGGSHSEKWSAAGTLLTLERSRSSIHARVQLDGWANPVHLSLHPRAGSTHMVCDVAVGQRVRIEGFVNAAGTISQTLRGPQC